MEISLLLLLLLQLLFPAVPGMLSSAGSLSLEQQNIFPLHLRTAML